MNKEKYILASMLMDELAISKALSELTTDHFVTFKHVFKDFRDIYNKEKCLDVGLIAEKGYTVQYIADISMGATTTVYMDKYIEKLKEDKYIRDCKDYASKILSARKIEDLDKIVSNQPIISNSKEIIPLEVACQSSLNNLSKRAKQKNSLKGIPTGFKLLDRISGGLQKGQLILIEGKTNVGKSLLAQKMAINIAENGSVIWFGLEMPKVQLADRFMIIHSKILTSQNYNNPKTITQSQKQAIEKMKPDNVMKNLNMIGFDEMKHKTLTEIKAIIFNEIQTHGKPKVIFIDYLKKIRGGEGRQKWERDQDNFTKILDYAEDMMIPIVLIVSQNKNGVTSGDSEMLYDAHQHYILTKDEEAAMIEIIKNRDGGKGEIPMRWVSEYLRFEEVRSEY